MAAGVTGVSNSGSSETEWVNPVRYTDTNANANANNYAAAAPDPGTAADASSSLRYAAFACTSAGYPA
jgi:hypothetical protein